MENQEVTPGLGERIIKEIIATPALKEVFLLQIKDIRPETASGVVKTLLWGDPGISMSLFGALPDAANWLLEFLLELGRQLNGLPEPLLKDILGRIGAGIDRERLGELPQVYGRLLRRLLLGEGRPPEEVRDAVVSALNRALAAIELSTAQLEANREEIARTLRRAWKELDTASLARTMRRVASLLAAAARPERGEGEEKGVAGAVKLAAGAAAGLLAMRFIMKRTREKRKTRKGIRFIC
ncbi:hypothetical protein [Candidatus Solincola tengchongensis]|uniref:hypothetical protein n=1 Tax=Candidatus Solincola tengchongensis TaxID=2900693 RepID=UPI00257AB652|nr:hypothetical protein [Candidatus Solincola tengchongensis]